MGNGVSAEQVVSAVESTAPAVPLEPGSPARSPARGLPATSRPLELRVVTKARLPFCKVSAPPTAAVSSVVAKVARKAGVSPSDVKLTHRTEHAVRAERNTPHMLALTHLLRCRLP